MSSKSTTLKFVDPFEHWLKEVAQKRLRLGGSSITDFKFAKCRVRHLKGPNVFPELTNADSKTQKPGKCSILYWMVRDHRVQDNWAFLYSQRLAIKFGVPLHVCFCIAPRYQADTLRQFAFMVDGLAEVEEDCRSLQIPFHVVETTAESESVGVAESRKRSFAKANQKEDDRHCREAVSKAVVKLVGELNVGCLVTDFLPLRAPTAWMSRVAELLPSHIPFCQVDAHNIVPTWFASDKLEYAARTIRRKLHEKATDLLTEFPPVISHPFSNVLLMPKPTDWNRIKNRFNGDSSIGPVKWAKPGARASFKTLHTFIDKRLSSYATQRNDPTKSALSDLSPWFHFGQIAPQRVILEVKAVRCKQPNSVDGFIEEAFVRRELADNFCFYNPDYDSIKGAANWAQETLRIHAKDAREPAYTEIQMESAETGDDLWNASQRQLVTSGKMHGFLRMYWAKKILEWHPDGPVAALQLAISLNDRFSLDGCDPNGYVGVMWSICGVHDQGWAERRVFGKIRCMTYKGCQGKFSVPTFVSQY